MRTWFEAHHSTAGELSLGFHKKQSGEPSVTWPEAVDVALCFGWIDGVRKNIDERRYKIRFTPRRPRSIWSAVNMKRVPELTAAGLMHPEGLKAFEQRVATRSGIYSYEQKVKAEFTDEHRREFSKHAAAWKFFQAQPPGYRQVITWWVSSARKEETRLKRLRTLIEACAQGRRLR